MANQWKFFVRSPLNGLAGSAAVDAEARAVQRSVESCPLLDTLVQRVMPSPKTIDTIEKAWSERFHRWRGYALALTGNWTDAEEVVQEAVARTMRADPRLRTERDAHHYVLAAVKTAALQLFESRRRLRLTGDDEQFDRAEIASDPLRLVLQDEAREVELALTQKALNALRELNEQQREVVELLVLREPPLKLRQVAEIQGAPISTVHSRLQSALRELGRRLRPPGE